MIQSTQTTIRKRKNTIFSIKSRRTAIAVLLLVVLCYLFSTIAQATETSININRINTFDMYGYDANLSSQNWRPVSYSITSSNSLKTEWIGYGQTRQRIYLSFLNSVNIKQYRVEFDIKAKNINPTNESVPSVRIPQNSSTWTLGTANLTNQTTEGNDTYYTYHIKIERSGMNTTQSTMSIYTYFSIVSTEYCIENFICILNDSVQMAFDEYTQANEQLRQAKDNLFGTVDENGLLVVKSHAQLLNEQWQHNKQVLANAGFTVNKVYYDSILNDSNIVSMMMYFTLTITICSYMLFGKLR